MIRVFQHGDHAAIAEIFTSAIHQIACEVYSPEQCLAWSGKDPNPEHWQKRCELKRPFVDVTDSGEITGFLELDPDGHIDCAYINPKFARRGIMTRLVEHAVETSFAAGIERVYVEASICAQPLFAKLGFGLLSENGINLGGIDLTNYKMEKLRASEGAVDSNPPEGNPYLPPPFYFNGRLMPRWAAIWHLPPSLKPHHERDWDELLDDAYLQRLNCRLDHTGVVESEDPLIFRVCAQEVLKFMLEHPQAALKEIAQSHFQIPEEEIFMGITSGLGLMIAAVHAERRALWTSGEEEDRQRLLDKMARLAPHPAFNREDAEPHAIQRRMEQLGRCRHQLTQLRRLAEKPGLPRWVRKLVLELPPTE